MQRPESLVPGFCRQGVSLFARKVFDDFTRSYTLSGQLKVWIP